MFIELHILQNFAPSNLNRDDTNSPKDCTFGGYRRARISSQCLKRSIRQNPQFQGTVQGNVGVRTKLLTEAIIKHLLATRTTDTRPEAVRLDEAKKVVHTALQEAGYKLDGDKTAVLLFLSPAKIQGYSSAIHDQYDVLLEKVNSAPLKAEKTDKSKADKKAEKPKADPKLKELTDKLKRLGSTTEAADIALFGRMVAENTNMNIDAACQVAHAISTHAVAVEMDFFTAVDDLQPKADTGAGMMGVIEFNSACFYRYALLDFNQLLKNLNQDRPSAIQAALGFCKAAVAAIPTGKQNSMAAHNPPSYIRLKIHDGGTPWSLANAYVKPIRTNADNADLVRESIKQLCAYNDQLVSVYGNDGLKVERAVSTYSEVGDGSISDLWKSLIGALS